jgi:hypothetical protein
MRSDERLTEPAIKDLVNAWYHALDLHAPEFELLPMLSDGELEMRFPEATLRNLAEFELWYQGVIRIFFDEVHQMQELDIRVSDDGARADVRLVVYWEASRWKPPARNSERLKIDAAQTWIVERSRTTGLPVIRTYVVDELRPRAGSAAL